MINKIPEKNSNTDLQIGSLFDGIGVFLLFVFRYGNTPIWASEIEKAPMFMTKQRNRSRELLSKKNYA